MKVRLSERARTDVLAIRKWVARDNPAAAHRLVERLLKRLRTLEALPLSGRAVPEWPDAEIRELIEGNYRLVYRITRQTVVVLQVFEGHRQVPP